MRIYFKTLSRADRYFSRCKTAILQYIPEVDRDKYPSQRMRNAFCSGLGYSSYDELRRTVFQNLVVARDLPDVESVRQASIVGFTRAIQIIQRVDGISLLLDSPQLPSQLSETVIRSLFEHGDLRSSSGASVPKIS
jgi:hypothetical protein